MKIVRDDLRYLLFAEIYQRLGSAKAKRKAYGIIESALQCLARKGFDQVSLEMISREAGVSRPLLKHYFEGIEEIRLFAIKYVRLLFQKFVIDAVEKEQTPERMLAAYVTSCLRWAEVHRTHAIVWLTFLHRCVRHTEFRALNTEAVKVGEARIAAIIRDGMRLGVFSITDPECVAKSIQVLVMGAMITSASENFEKPKLFATGIQNACFTLAGIKG